jgi:hypothetical protein
MAYMMGGEAWHYLQKNSTEESNIQMAQQLTTS